MSGSMRASGGMSGSTPGSPHSPPSIGPPWILGQRGSPLEAPENTLASLERALDVGLDGIAYEVRACAGGDLVLMADATLERTTDGQGLVGERTLSELASLDAGGFFDARFRGERVPLLEEALALEGDLERGKPQHVLVVHERGIAVDVARAVHETARDRSVRVASRSPEDCLDARDAGLSPMYVVDDLGQSREPGEQGQIGEPEEPEEPDEPGEPNEIGERVRRVVRAERLVAVGASVRAWLRAGKAAWPCERWALGVDAPDELLAACRAPLHGLLTHEPLRALAIRALAQIARDDDGPYPIQVPELEVVPPVQMAPQQVASGSSTPTRTVSATALRGDWCSSWNSAARVRNPFAFEARVTCGILPRRGAFDIEGVPVARVLAAGEEIEVPFALTGGSWRTGGDPLFFAQFRWRRGPGRPAGSLLLDAPLVRLRRVRADALSQRLVLLRESPSEVQATMTLRRHRRWLFVSIENAGGIDDARAIVHFDGREYFGGRGVRVPLPEDFDRRAEGVPFSCAIVGRRAGERVVRRWAGGVPDEIDAGSPGRILASAKS
jgi:hypothetical protein